MVRFYCDYCKSYLTHDSTSVRKYHLSGKNHVKLVCDYYEEEAKKLGKWNPDDMPFEITTENLYRGIPGSGTKSMDYYKLAETKTLPPPPTLPNLPSPPPSVLHNVANKKGVLASTLKTMN